MVCLHLSWWPGEPITHVMDPVTDALYPLCDTLFPGYHTATRVWMRRCRHRAYCSVQFDDVFNHQPVWGGRNGPLVSPSVLSGSMGNAVHTPIDTMASVGWASLMICRLSQCVGRLRAIPSCLPCHATSLSACGKSRTAPVGVGLGPKNSPIEGTRAKR